MKKNWKLNRGKQLNKTSDNKQIDNNDNFNHDDYMKQDILLSLYKDYLNFNEEINIQRVVDLEFSKIKYVQDTKQNIKQYFKWKK